MNFHYARQRRDRNHRWRHRAESQQFKIVFFGSVLLAGLAGAGYWHQFIRPEVAATPLEVASPASRISQAAAPSPEVTSAASVVDFRRDSLSCPMQGVSSFIGDTSWLKDEQRSSIG